MDATQILDDFDEEDFNSISSKKTVAFLKVRAVGEFPETVFPVYEGENIIGRHDTCDITIPLQAVSKKHACIDVHGKNHWICDYNSRNKTRRNQMFLKPQAFYELVHEVELMVADVKCQYLFVQTDDVVEKDIISDSGSETASESMMPHSTEGDNKQEDGMEGNLTGLAKTEKLEGSMEQYLDQPTQEYSYKNPDECPIVFCIGTDDEETDDEETDDESGHKKETATQVTNSSTIDAADTLGCNTLPNTQEPDTIPATPFTHDVEPPSRLKRSVDVTVRRISAGNTLAYGLSTLESPNSTRESMDVSESEDVKGNEKKLLHSMEDEILDDATQHYEAMETPGSPEMFLDESGTGNDGPENKVSELGETPQGINHADEISEGQTLNCKTSENNIFEDKTSGCKSSESEIFENKVVDDTMETQAYGFDSLPEDEDMATQAYGVSDTGDELATQAYGVEDDIEVPKISNVFKVPGALNTQELNEDIDNIVSKDEIAANHEKVQNEDDEIDFQPTQKYIENQVMVSGETSFARGAEWKSDSDSDFLPTMNLSRKKAGPKSPLQSSTPTAVVVVEGENALSTEKRCYVECPGRENNMSQDEDHDDKPSTGKKSARGRKNQTATQAKGEAIKNTTRLSISQNKHDESRRNDTVIREDTGEQGETIVVKRGRGRLTRSKSSTATPQNSKGKRNEEITDEMKRDVAGEGKAESLPKAKRRTRKRNISINTETECNEEKSSDVKPDVESIKTEGKAESLPKAKRRTRKRNISVLNTETECNEEKSSDVKPDVESIKTEGMAESIPKAKRRTRKRNISEANTETECNEEKSSDPKPDVESIKTEGKEESSSSIRSARKGRKQEKEDSEASSNHSADVKIIFTGLQDLAFTKAKKIVDTLGGEVVERLEHCTHLVTDKVRRTVKLLCAVSRGIPVVDISWLDASKKSKSFVDCNSFILNDKEAQKKFNFSMQKSLKIAQKTGLLDSYKFHITPHVRPPPADMKEIINCAKGQTISKMPTSQDGDVIVLSCDEDIGLCQKAHIKNAYTAELLLSGILRQEIDLEQHKLILDAPGAVNSSPVKSKGRRKR